MTTPYAHERQIAELAVLRASILTKKVLSTIGSISKQDSTPVTVADFAAQVLIISAIRNVFPDDAYVGEEDSSSLQSDPELKAKVWQMVSGAEAEIGGVALAKPVSAQEMCEMLDLGGRGRGGGLGRFWTIDPIDGTAAFLRGEQYCVALALVEDGKEVLGVLGCPNLSLRTGRVDESIVDKDGLGHQLSAIIGQGSTIKTMTPSGLEQPRPLAALSRPSSPKDMHIVNYAKSTSSRHEIIHQLATHFGARYPNSEIFSSHMRYVALIVGGADVQLRVPKSNSRMYLWDHAGAQLIYREVGGKVTDLDGKDMDFGAGRELTGNRGLVAAQEGIHGLVLETLTKILEDEKAQETK